jgi:hypothetical protein
MFNNYFKNITDYGIAARQGAHALIQNNVYENVVLPITTNKFTGEGYACESGNIFTACGANSITQTGCDFWTSAVLPYSYTLDAASNVTSIVPPNVGVGKITITPPSGSRTDLYDVVELNNKPGDALIVYQNYPNPVKGVTAFRIYSPSSTKVQINLFDVSGKKLGVIADRILTEGYNLVNYSARLRPGVYIYEVRTNKESIRKTMVIQ